MKKTTLSTSFRLLTTLVATLLLLGVAGRPVQAAPATLLFEDDFEGGIPGWTAVQPAGAYIDGPMLWQFDKVSNSFRENSNIYTDSAASSTSRRAVMFISDAVAPASDWEYKARLTAGDDDGFGLIWGYENEGTFYRASFARQSRTAWPHTGLIVDRMSNAVPTDVTVPDSTFVNTANRPFDVKIAVTNGLLTLTVDDDPLGTVGGPFHYDLVVGQPLPATPSGNVGIFSWGQQGGNPAAFRVQSPTLNGVPLDTAAINNVLTNDWSFTITPSSSNDYPDDTGTWGFGEDINGPLGMMIENNDSAPQNNAASTTNTPVNAAVIGDLSWSNYVVSVRFQTPDNDGFGMLLRWHDRTNWYRIGFRNQANGAGIKTGISVQKNVNLTFDEMLYDPGFIPPIYVPFDVHAAIRDNALQIMCVVNPDSASPTVASFGPIDMAASTLVPDNLATGKAGVFSWAQRGNAAADADYGTGVDSFHVRKVDGEGLLVSSAYGTPNPPAGLHDLPVGGSVTARVDSVVLTAPGIRQVSAGWSGSGSAPTTGNTNEAVFSLNQFSLINWRWQTQYQLTVDAGAGGTALASDGPWINPGSNVTATATANPGFVFTGWSGDSLSTSPNLAFQMTGPRTLTANFAVDSDNDGLADNWENQYFSNLSQDATGNPDGDSLNNLAESQLGTNPNAVETPVFTDGLASRWINETRDRALPGWFGVTNFGSGFRGLWEVSNHNRNANSAGPNDAPFIAATNYATNASFQMPIIAVRTNDWNPAWAGTFSLSAEYSVGDNDGLSLYFRYLNPSNWYRITLCGEATTSLLRPLQGISIQKRTNGWFSAITPTVVLYPGFDFFPDPLDSGGYKRFRVTVNGTNDTFEVRVIGWNVLLEPNGWDPASETILSFTDADVPSGRIGVGSWGMGGFGAWNSTTNDPENPGVLVNPVGAGLFVDNIVVRVDDTNAFVENWETAPLHSDFPAGWNNPYATLPGGLLGDWHLSAHGTIANFNAAFGTAQSGTIEFPNADGEGPILLAPALTNANYLLELGLHPWDDGGMGFVYDYQDTNNFARVLFNSQVPGTGQLLQGLNISRKSGGVWNDIIAGDNAFIYTPGRPFDVRLANNNGVYTLTAWNADDPGTAYHWQWTDQATVAGNRVGVAIWDMPDAHFNYLRASSLTAVALQTPFKITNISLSGGNVVLDISKPDGSSYHVLRATEVTGPYTTNAASQTGAQYSEPLPVGSTYFYRLQLLP